VPNAVSVSWNEKMHLPASGRILIRATNWIGDAVMSLPAIRAVRSAYPAAHIAVLARPWVADLYARESSIDELLLYSVRAGWRDARAKWKLARSLSRFDAAILLQNAFEAAAVAWLARIPIRIGYDSDARGWLLTHPVPVPEPGEIPRHERYYYLELLRRAGILEELPRVDDIRLEGSVAAGVEGARAFRERNVVGDVIGVSPGAAFGKAKRWLPERFAQAAGRIAREHNAAVALFGSAGERQICEEIAAQLAGVPVLNLAGNTTLREFIALAAACRLFLTNDSGAMHVAAALGIPTVTIFGATNPAATGPAGSNAVIVREPVECSPCLLRECPIDHRCMTRVTVERVTQAAGELWERTVSRGYQDQNTST
jgi:heptosyltransferase-2